ncbi:lipopolysaccharide heptosyltransferase II [Candidatus Omnitrophus magneticus]|uniref:lipopolysaccharide heptosyltransferase II n=1 Tax=Candidatus Omnitrophus magneticus TaxID=1609969 RepID=A0A0F0CQ12_9BACT|nr:lipopolysaccharide heptosyltransferase II [Candidatus Omnitrophus magneticus]
MIIRTDRIGEVLLSTVATSAVKKVYPTARITFVTSEYSRPLLENNKDISEIICLDTYTKGQEIKRAFLFSKILKKKQFSTALILNPHKISHLACFFAGIPIRAGYNRKWPFLLTKKIQDNRDNGLKHEIEYTFEFLSACGIKSELIAPNLSVDKTAEQRVEKFLQEKGFLNNQHIIAIHPGASNPAKLWPKENYRDLALKLKNKFSARIIILGGNDEKPLGEWLSREIGEDSLNTAGAFDLKELTAIIKKSACFIGNDTGPAHIAASLNIPVITIFGRRIPGAGPKRWRPWGEKNIVFYEDADCGVCKDSLCDKSYRCLTLVTVKKVFTAASGILKNIIIKNRV